MIKIIVRSKRDADAVKAMLRIFYREWDVKVYTMHGSRTIDRALDEIKSIITQDSFYIVLLGREDTRVALELDKILPPNVAVRIVPGKRVRNIRVDQLAHEFTLARSMFRLSVGWDDENKCFRLGLRKGSPLNGFEYNPAYDIFFGLGEHYMEKLMGILGVKPCKNPLLVRKLDGLHDIYCGPGKYAEIHIFDEGIKPVGRLTGKAYVEEISESKLVEANQELLKLYERISLEFLKKYREWADTVIVPWSGGKDSTVALWLALKVFPRGKVKAVYVDTGVEFPQTREYVEEISRRLGIEVYTIYAGIDKGLLEENMPMPTHDNRWCTGRKIDALEKKVAEIAEGNTLIVTGDRDAESSRRSIRPPTRREETEALVVTPIKLWSTAHVQLYMLMEKIPVNPLYHYGFYRIGCYICPALRSWELYIMLNTPEIYKRLINNKLYQEFIKQRLKE